MKNKRTIKISAGILVVLVMSLYLMPVASSLHEQKQSDSDVEMLIHGGFGTTFVVNNKKDETISVTWKIETKNTVMSSTYFVGAGQKSEIKRFNSGGIFSTVTATLEYEYNTITKQGFAILGIFVLLT